MKIQKHSDPEVQKTKSEVQKKNWQMCIYQRVLREQKREW